MEEVELCRLRDALPQLRITLFLMCHALSLRDTQAVQAGLCDAIRLRGQLGLQCTQRLCGFMRRQLCGKLCGSHECRRRLVVCPR